MRSIQQKTSSIPSSIYSDMGYSMNVSHDEKMKNPSPEKKDNPYLWEHAIKIQMNNQRNQQESMNLPQPSQPSQFSIGVQPNSRPLPNIKSQIEGPLFSKPDTEPKTLFGHVMANNNESSHGQPQIKPHSFFKANTQDTGSSIQMGDYKPPKFMALNSLNDEPKILNEPNYFSSHRQLDNLLCAIPQTSQQHSNKSHSPSPTNPNPFTNIFSTPLSSLVQPPSSTFNHKTANQKQLINKKPQGISDGKLKPLAFPNSPQMQQHIQQTQQIKQAQQQSQQLQQQSQQLQQQTQQQMQPIQQYQQIQHIPQQPPHNPQFSPSTITQSPQFIQSQPFPQQYPPTLQVSQQQLYCPQPQVNWKQLYLQMVYSNELMMLEAQNKILEMTKTSQKSRRENFRFQGNSYVEQREHSPINFEVNVWKKEKRREIMIMYSEQAENEPYQWNRQSFTPTVFENAKISKDFTCLFKTTIIGSQGENTYENVQTFKQETDLAQMKKLFQCKFQNSFGYGYCLEFGQLEVGNVTSMIVTAFQKINNLPAEYSFSYSARKGSIIRDLKISNEWGSIYWWGTIDISNVDFSKGPTIIPNEADFWNEGGIQKTCVVTLKIHLTKPNFTTHDGTINVQKLQKNLRKQCQKQACHFIELDSDRMQWSFKIVKDVIE